MGGWRGKHGINDIFEEYSNLSANGNFVAMLFLIIFAMVLALNYIFYLVFIYLCYFKINNCKTAKKILDENMNFGCACLARGPPVVPICSFLSQLLVLNYACLFIIVCFCYFKYFR